MPAATHTFGVFAFDSGSLELSRDGRRVAIEPQPARALAVLVARAGEVVTREEMRQAIWGAETHVDYDRGLAYCIGQVRAALGDSAEQPRFVQTLPRRGFRFIAPVAAGDRGLAPAGVTPHANLTPASTPAAPAPEPTVPSVSPLGASVRPSPRWGPVAAVLAATAVAGVVGWQLRPTSARPVVAVSIFDNETGDAAHDAFITGLSDLVVTELTNLAPARIGVVGNASALRQRRNIRDLKTLATAVQADYVVLGQLQRQDEGRLRVILHFIRLSDGVHLSAQRFLRPAAEVAAFEGDVLTEARRVVQRFVLDQAPS